jgi:hypothetical protein
MADEIDELVARALSGVKLPTAEAGGGGDDIDALVDRALSAPAAAAPPPKKKGVLARVVDQAKENSRKTIRTAGDLARALPEAAIQTARDIPSAIQSAQTGVQKMPLKVIRSVAEMVGADDVDAMVTSALTGLEENRQKFAATIGANAENPGVKAAETGGELAIGMVGGNAAMTGLKAAGRALPGVRAVIAAGDKARAARAAGVALKGKERLYPLAENLVEGQIVGALFEAGNEDPDFARGALLGAGFDVGAAALGPVAKGIRYAGQKAVATKLGGAVARKFRWLGNVGDDVRLEFERYWSTVYASRADAAEFVEAAATLTPTERLRAGQLLRGGISTATPPPEVIAAGQRGLSEIEKKLIALQGDTTLAVELRRKQVSDLRQQRRDLEDAIAGKGTLDPYIAGRQGLDQSAAKAKALYEKGRGILDPESKAFRQRKSMDVVFYESLTREQLAARRTAKQNLLQRLRKEGVDVELADVSRERQKLFETIDEIGDEAARQEALDRLTKLTTKEAALKDVFARAGVKGDNVIREIEKARRVTRGMIDETTGKIREVETVQRQLTREGEDVQSALDRSRRPLTAEQKQTVKSGEYFAGVEDKRRSGWANAAARDAKADLRNATGPKVDEARRRVEALREIGQGNSAELFDQVARDLKQTDVERIASLEQRASLLSDVIKVSEQERNVLLRDRDALRKELGRLTSVPHYSGRSKHIQAIVDKIDDINKSISTSYRFGGTRYSPRMYMEKEQEDLLQHYGVFPVGPKLAGKELLSRRDVDIPVEVRQKMQEILDPTYPVAKRVHQLANDRAASELFEGIASNPAVVSEAEQKGFVQLKGSRLGPDIEALRNEQQRIQNVLSEAGPDTNPAKIDQLTKRLEQIEAEAAKTLNGKWVSKDIAGEIQEIGGTKTRGARMYQALLRLWKTNKTALNPATHFRNIFGNTIFLDFAGVGVADQPRLYLEAANEIQARSKTFLEFRRTGLELGTYTDAELRRWSGIAERPLKDADEWFERLAEAPMNLPGTKALIDAYNAEDTIARFIAFKKARGLGLTVEQSADYVDRYIPNYGRIPKNTMTGAMELYSPFFKFTYASTPILLKNMIDHPLKVAKWFALGRAVNQLSADMLGIPEDRQSAIRDMLPNYMQRPDVFAPSVLPLMPKVDRYNRLVFLDTSYWIPGNNLVDGSNSILPIQALDPGNPALRVVAEIWLNKQGYNGMPIFDEVLDSPEERAWKASSYAVKAGLPTIAGWGAERLYRGALEKPDYAGRKQGLGHAMADAIFGIKLRAFDPVEQRRFRRREVDEKLREVARAITKARKDQRYTPGEREERIKELRELRRELREEKRRIGASAVE